MPHEQQLSTPIITRTDAICVQTGVVLQSPVLEPYCMRLLTHNVLRNSAKGVIQGFPFNLEATKVEVKETDFDPQFIKNLLSTLNLEGLRVAVSDLGLDVSALPTALTPELQEDESFLKALHSMLMDIHVIEGTLICPETKRRFPIEGGVPNMMLTDEELP